MNRDPIWNNILARLNFLQLVVNEFPDLHYEAGGHEAVEAYKACVADLGVNRNLFGYARISLNQARQSTPMLGSLKKWAKRFNLKADWFLDHLLETIAIALMSNDPLNDRVGRAWNWALANQSSNARWVVHGPEIVFRYTWPVHLSLGRNESLEIEEHYQNPLRVLDNDFLRDIKDKFAFYVFEQFRSENLDIEEGQRWSALEQIAYEILKFNRKLAACEKKARKSANKYVNQTKGDLSRLPSVRAFPIKGRKISRNLRWLVMYQVKSMSYGDIAKAEGENRKTVIDGVKAGAGLIDLELRPPNKAGRKKGSRTVKTTNQIVR